MSLMFVGKRKKTYICTANARIAQLVEHDLAKVGVAGSSPVSRSFLLVVAQVVELVDTLDLKSSGHCARAGSSPALGTLVKRQSR